MSDTGWVSPGTMADDDAVGTVTWSDPDNAKASDDSYAAAFSYGGEYSHYLKATNFGFSIPSGATIDGILVEIQKWSSGMGIDENIKIVKSDGSIGSENKASEDSWTDTDSGTIPYKSYGASDDDWSETWAYTDINDSDFGVVLSVNLQGYGNSYIDHIRIKVYYTEGGATSAPFPMFFRP